MMRQPVFRHGVVGVIREESTAQLWNCEPRYELARRIRYQGKELRER